MLKLSGAVQEFFKVPCPIVPTCATCTSPSPPKVQAAIVRDQLQAARDYTLTATDISHIIRDKKAKGLVKKSLVSQRADLLLERKAAEEHGDKEAMQR